MRSFPKMENSSYLVVIENLNTLYNRITHISRQFKLGNSLSLKVREENKDDNIHEKFDKGQKMT